MDTGIRFNGSCKLRMDAIVLSRWGFALEVDLKLDSLTGSNTVIREYLDEKFELIVNSNTGVIKVEIDGVINSSNACSDVTCKFRIQYIAGNYFRLGLSIISGINGSEIEITCNQVVVLQDSTD